MRALLQDIPMNTVFQLLQNQRSHYGPNAGTFSAGTYLLLTGRAGDGGFRVRRLGTTISGKHGKRYYISSVHRDLEVEVPMKCKLCMDDILTCGKTYYCKQDNNLARDYI